MKTEAPFVPAVRDEELRRARYEVCGLLPELNGSVLTISVQPLPLGSSGCIELLL